MSTELKTPDVKVCACLMERYPTLEIVRERQLPPRLDLELRQAVFLVVSAKPWTADYCDCCFGVVHIAEALNAGATAEHGEGRGHEGSIVLIHRSTLKGATDLYEEFVAGLTVEDYQKRHPDE